MQTRVGIRKNCKIGREVICINCESTIDSAAHDGLDYFELNHMTAQGWLSYSKKHEPIAVLVGWRNGGDAEKAMLTRLLLERGDLPVILMAGKADSTTAVWALRNQLADYVEWPTESIYLVQRLAEIAQKNFTDCFPKADVSSVVVRKICGTQPAVDMIKQHYAEHLSLPVLAQCCRLSNIRFVRRFKYEHGMSPQRFLRNHRLHMAKLLLTQSHMSIKRIAAEVGFDDIAYFSRVFKRVEQCSPSQFRIRAVDARLSTF